jgi:hypothetical protein
MNQSEILNIFRQASSKSDVLRMMPKFHPDHHKRNGISFKEAEDRQIQLNLAFEEMKKRIRNNLFSFKGTLDTDGLTQKFESEFAGAAQGTAQGAAKEGLSTLSKTALGAAAVGATAGIYYGTKHLHKKSPKFRALVRKVRKQSRPMKSTLRSVKVKTGKFVSDNKKALGLGAAIATLGAAGYIAYKRTKHSKRSKRSKRSNRSNRSKRSK